MFTVFLRPGITYALDGDEAAESEGDSGDEPTDVILNDEDNDGGLESEGDSGDESTEVISDDEDVITPMTRKKYYKVTIVFLLWVQSNTTPTHIGGHVIFNNLLIMYRSHLPALQIQFLLQRKHTGQATVHANSNASYGLLFLLSSSRCLLSLLTTFRPGPSLRQVLHI